MISEGLQFTSTRMGKFSLVPWGSTGVTRKIDRGTLRIKPFLYYRVTLPD
jgi:hypothetical protein